MHHILLHHPPSEYHLKGTAKLLELTLQGCNQGHRDKRRQNGELRV